VRLRRLCHFLLNFTYLIGYCVTYELVEFAKQIGLKCNDVSLNFAGTLTEDRLTCPKRSSEMPNISDHSHWSIVRGTV